MDSTFHEGDEFMIQNVVVQSGDSLYTIAQKYQTSPEAITSLNKIDGNNSLVIGQTLLVDTQNRTYFVQPGDSLYKISLTYNTTGEKIASASGISANSFLQVGQQLHIPTSSKSQIESIAYLQPTSKPISQALLNATTEASPLLTYLAPFSFEAKADGTLKAPAIEGVLDITKANRVIPMLVVSNIDEGGGFSPAIAHTIFTDKIIQNKFINTVIDTAKEYEMKDIHFDFENLQADDKNNYNNFLWNIKGRLPQGYTLSTTLIPKTSDSMTSGTYGAHDYATHGQIVDFVVIMTYDWGWQGGPPMAVSPIKPVKQVIDYAKTKMPASKIMMGQNLYGFDWKVPFVQGNPPAKALSSIGAIELARNNNVPISYDSDAQAPYFTYTETNGQNHEVWFEDNRSIQNKFNLIKTEGIRGISYWKLGLPFPQNWTLLNENFQIAKKV